MSRDKIMNDNIKTTHDIYRKYYIKIEDVIKELQQEIDVIGGIKMKEEILNNILTNHWTEIKAIKKRLDELEKRVE